MTVRHRLVEMFVTNESCGKLLCSDTTAGQPSGIQRRVVWLNYIDIAEERVASVIRAAIMEAVYNSETSIYYETATRHISIGFNFITRRYENLKSHTAVP
jgi:hypothetical protein